MKKNVAVSIEVPLDERRTTEADFPPDTTYHYTRNIGSEYWAQRLLEFGKKIPYPKKGRNRTHSARL